MKKLNLAQEEKAKLEKKMKQISKNDTQKELETNALITQTLSDLKKYQNMDQMKEEEAQEIRNQTNVLEMRLEAQEKTLKNLD
jgi:hypothetical protein